MVNMVQDLGLFGLQLVERLSKQIKRQFLDGRQFFHVNSPAMFPPKAMGWAMQAPQR
jgi:hypothetical protein